MNRIQDFKGIVFDMDGVLRIGKNPIKGADKVFNKLHSKSIIVTNECRRTPHKIKEELRNMGIETYDTPILTAGTMTYYYLYDIISGNRSRDTIYNVLTVGEEGLLEIMEELGELDNYNKITPSFIDTALKKNLEFKNSARYINYLVIGTINNISIPLLSVINNYLKVFSNVKVLTTCPDMIDPEEGLFIMPNHLIHILNYNKKNSLVPYHTGKPNPIVTKYIERYFNEFDNEGDIVFVGDTLDTDIKLANEAFFKSILVLSGNTEYEDLKKSQITPDHVINSIDNLFQIISI